MILALVAERAAGAPYHQLVAELVIRPSGLTGTEFLRTDELPGDAAVGYLFADGLRTNVLHLPVVATGDGGIFTTADDMVRLWTSFSAGRVVSAEAVTLMTSAYSHDTGGERPYGMGFWLASGDDTAVLVGADAGQSFWSAHRRSDGTTASVLSNTTEGAWPVVERLQVLFAAPR